MNIQNLEKPDGAQFDLSPRALSRWDTGLQAADKSDNAISMFDVIGDDFFGEGVTTKRIAAALRSIGSDKDVVVNINSPGGDLFEGMAIHNLLKEHDGKVTVKVLGLAASAASIIAMAGDEIQMAKSSFMMIHNTWVLAIGNRNDLREMADSLEPFDDAMADIYADRTGQELSDIRAMMDDETWISGRDAIEDGFADQLLGSEDVSKNNKAQIPEIRKADVMLAKAGMSRSERRKLFESLKSATHDAGEGTQDAAREVSELLTLTKSLTEVLQ